MVISSSGEVGGRCFDSNVKGTGMVLGYLFVTSQLILTVPKVGSQWCVASKVYLGDWENRFHLKISPHKIAMKKVKKVMLLFIHRSLISPPRKESSVPFKYKIV